MNKKRKKPMPKNKKPLSKNLFDTAGPINTQEGWLPGDYIFDSSSNSNLDPNFGKSLAGILGIAGTSAINSIVNPKGNTTQFGNIASTIGDAATMVNPAIGLAIKGAGMLANAAFGSNINESNVANIKSNIENTANTTFNGNTAAELVSQYSNFTPIDRVKKSDVGSDGWFNDAASELKDELNAKIKTANETVKNNFLTALDNVAYNNNLKEQSSFYSIGGPLFKEFSNGVTIINEGGSHEENPHEGIQIGIDPEGIPNMVEEGEVIFNDYVFSDRLIVPKTVRKQYKLRGNKETTFAESAKEITKMSEEMPNDPIVKRTMELRLNQLMQEQEIVRETNQNKKNRHSNGGEVNTYKNGEKIKQWYDSNLKGNWDKVGTGLMQAAPVFGSLAATINDWTGGNEADYTNVYKYEDAINKAYKPVSARTLSDYLEYRPYDTSFELNKLAATQAASRRALLNSSAGNPSAARAAILASDYNYSNQIGDTYRRAQEYNDANRRMVADFNRGTSQFNAQAINAANQFNAQQAANKATALGQAAQWRDQINQANRAEKSANLTGLLEGISGLGQTFYNQGRVKWLQDNNIIVGNDGKLYNKDLITKNHTSSNEEAAELLKKLNPEELKKLGFITAANGGKIKRTKNKRRLS